VGRAGAADADEQEHRPAAEVANQIQRRDRSLGSAPDRVQESRQRQVIDVVAGPR
jgi:hypothetical protein